jgi:hypothetical protein
MLQRIDELRTQALLWLKKHPASIGLLSTIAIVVAVLFYIPISGSTSDPVIFQTNPASSSSALHNEELAPASVPTAEGARSIVAGVGLVGGTGVLAPGDVQFDVPRDAAVQQVLLYWVGREGFSDENLYPPEPPDQSTIKVNGADVTGRKIGRALLDGPDDIVVAYRADITALGLVAQGHNTLTISGAPFVNFINSGAGVIVMVDDGPDSIDIHLRDGVDSAYIDASTSEQKVTAPQTFTFEPQDYNRSAKLSLFVAEVSEMPNDDTGTFRESKIIIEIEGSVVEFPNVLQSHDGPLWDTYTTAVNIPAGVSSISVWLESDSRGRRPASYSTSAPAAFQWIAAILDVHERTSTPIGSPKPEQIPTATPIRTPTPELTNTPTATPAPIHTPMPGTQPADTPTMTPTHTSTLEPVPTETLIPTLTFTATPEPVITPSPMPSPSSTPMPQSTSTPAPEPTGTPTPEPTSVPTLTPTPTPGPDLIHTPTATPTAITGSEPTSTPTPTPEVINTPTPASTPTASPEPTSSPTPESATTTSAVIQPLPESQ